MSAEPVYNIQRPTVCNIQQPTDLAMDRTEKHDLTRFFNMIKAQYVIPSPQPKIHGKVTCRDGNEYIEKPFNMSGESFYIFQWQVNFKIISILEDFAYTTTFSSIVSLKLF